MDHATALAAWQNFYVILGSSAGALTGLQFVVITLIAQARAASSMREIRAFGTPTVMHFCTALVISALMTAPWISLKGFDTVLGIFSAAGVIYSLTIFRHARKATYTPDLEDWIWYTAVPLIAYLTLLSAAVLLRWNTSWPLYLIAAAALVFLLLGVHNAWDTVTYIAIQRGHGENNAGEKGNASTFRP